MIGLGSSVTSAFGKEWFERWLRGMIISYIRKDYVFLPTIRAASPSNSKEWMCRNFL
jgi:hypothetical protein